MDSKIQGIFQTLSRLLPEYEKRTELCTKLQNQIEDHDKQLEICSSVSIEDLKVDGINEEVKRLVIQKLQDKCDQLKIDLQEQVSWFQSNSDLLKTKLKKCFDQNLCPDNEENIKMCQQLTKASEISHLLSNHAKKCKYLCLQQSENDAEVEDNIDELLGLKHTKEKKQSELSKTFDLSAKEVMNISDALDFYFSSSPQSEGTEKSVKTPKRK